MTQVAQTATPKSISKEARRQAVEMIAEKGKFRTKNQKKRWIALNMAVPPTESHSRQRRRALEREAAKRGN